MIDNYMTERGAVVRDGFGSTADVERLLENYRAQEFGARPPHEMTETMQRLHYEFQKTQGEN